MEAHFVKDLLEREDIAAEVRGEWLFGAMGEIPSTPETWPSVWVLEDTQLNRAAGLVADYERSDKPVRSDTPPT